MMSSELKLVIGAGILAALSPGLFAAACTTWTLGNGTTTIAPGTSASGTSTGTIPCTLGSDTFNNFYVFNSASSISDIAVEAVFNTPAVMSFFLSSNSMDNFDVIFEVTPGQGLLTISDSSASGSIVDTECSVEFVQGQSCTGQGGMVLGGETVSGSATGTIALAASPTGNDWIFETVSGVGPFTNSFASVPEPITLPLVGMALLGLGLVRRKYRQR